MLPKLMTQVYPTLLAASFSLAIGSPGILAQSTENTEHPGGETHQSDPTGQKLPLDSDDAELVRLGNKLLLLFDAEPKDRTITIPRFFASLVRIHFIDQAPHPDLTVTPEPNAWIIRWKPTVKFTNKLVLSFDSPPWLASEIGPIRQAGDGTVTAHACRAVTVGEKLRYEPQPHKNTVGYWTVPTDSAHWKLQIDRPGSFNVGILQGCGKGNGGSRGEMIIQSNNQPIDNLEFNVEETGHFQNFIWRSLGTIKIDQPGQYDLIVIPKSIAKNAFMDVRLLHLSPAR